MKSYYLVVALIVLILALASCAQPTKRIISPAPTNSVIDQPSDNSGSVPSIKPPVQTSGCENIECGNNMECRRGRCVCSAGTTKCGENCITIDQCCDDSGCNDKEKCVNNQCQEECSDIACDANKLCNSRGVCECPTDTVWCEFQNLCINTLSCCTGADCRGADDCILTGESAVICLKEDTDELCKRVKLGESDNFFVSEQYHTIGFAKSLPDNKVYLKVDFKNIVMKKTDSVRLSSGPLLSIDRTFSYGGNCG